MKEYPRRNEYDDDDDDDNMAWRHKSTTISIFQDSSSPCCIPFFLFPRVSKTIFTALVISSFFYLFISGSCECEGKGFFVI